MVLTAMVSVHTDDPGDTGANEVPGRKPITFLGGGEGTSVVFDLDAGVYSHVGLWSNEGEFLGSTTLGTSLEVAGALILGLTLSGGTLVPPVEFEAAVVPPVAPGYGSGTFSYWEPRRKDFGPENTHKRARLMPFYLQSTPQGVTVVRNADGTFTTVTTVTEELEATEGVRIYWGGKDNPVTEDEASELAAAGYGDYLNAKPEDAYGDGAYSEGDFGG